MQTSGFPRTKGKTSANRDLVSTSVLALWPGLEKSVCSHKFTVSFLLGHGASAPSAECEHSP